LPALFTCLDVAFPEFGWRGDASGWVATNREHTKSLPGGPRPERVVCHWASGFFVYGEGYTAWTTYVNGGTWPTREVFREVVKKLADLAGVNCPEREWSPEELKRAEERDRRASLLETFWGLTRDALEGEEGAEARDYLERRGLSAAAPGLGFLPSVEKARADIKARGFSNDEVTASGVLNREWEGRLIIPWRDRWGNLATFAARALPGKKDNGKKYLYLAGVEKAPLVAFGLDVALHKKADPLVLVEGLLDVVGLHALGFSNVAAIGGAGGDMTSDKWKGLAAFGVSRVVLALDNDEAGRAGTLKALENVRKVRNGGNVPVVDVLQPELLAPYKDPDELVREKELDAFRELLKHKETASKYIARSLVEKYRPRGEWIDGTAKADLMNAAMAYDTETDVRAGGELLVDFWPVITEATGVPIDQVNAWVQDVKESRAAMVAAEMKKALIRDAQRDSGALIREGDTGRAVEIFLTAGDNLRALEHRSNVEPIRSLSDELSPHRDRLEKWKGKRFMGLPQVTLPTLDQKTKGLRGLMLLAAMPGVGKTVLGVQLGFDVVRHNSDTCFLFLSLEMSRSDILTRLLSRVSGLPWEDLVFGNKPEMAIRIAKAEKVIADVGRRVRILDAKNYPEPTVEGVLSHLRRLKEETGTSRAFVLVDYLQVLPIPEKKAREIRSELDADKYRIGAMRDLRDGTMDDALMVISEARKPSGGSGDNTWGEDLGDVMGSARGTYTPDMVFLFHKLSKDKQIEVGSPSHRRTLTKLTIAKGRDGVSRGPIDLSFFYDLAAFQEGLATDKDRGLDDVFGIAPEVS